MPMFRTALVFFLGFSGIAAAEPPTARFGQANIPSSKPLNAQEFDAYVTGKTLTYANSGLIFGIEEYLPNRRVRWSTAPDECQYGSWFQKDEMICFTYEYGSRDHCWRFWQDDRGLVALAEGASADEALSELAQSKTGLNCPAPNVGV